MRLIFIILFCFQLQAGLIGGGGGGASSMTDLTDVAITTAVNKQTLIYNSTTDKFENNFVYISTLKSVNAAVDTYKATYDSASDSIEWKEDSYTIENDSVSVSMLRSVAAAVDTYKATYDTATDKILWKEDIYTIENDSVSVAMLKSVSAATDTYKATYDSATDKILWKEDAYTIAADSISVSMLKSVSAAVDTYKATYDSATDKILWKEDAGGAGGTIPNLEIRFDASSLQVNHASFAPLELIGTTVKVLVRAFDDTTEEYSDHRIKIPEDIKTDGTITFKAYVMAKTAAASKNIELRFGHKTINESEAYDAAYTNLDSGDKAIDATQGDITIVEFTETVSNLGWAADDLIIFRLSRIDASENDLAGDMYLFYFVIEIPRE